MHGLAESSKVAGFRNNSFPFYEELSIVYVKDHANVKNVESHVDVVEELEKEWRSNGKDELHGILEDDTLVGGSKG